MSAGRPPGGDVDEAGGDFGPGVVHERAFTSSRGTDPTAFCARRKIVGRWSMPRRKRGYIANGPPPNEKSPPPPLRQRLCGPARRQPDVGRATASSARSPIGEVTPMGLTFLRWLFVCCDPRRSSTGRRRKAACRSCCHAGAGSSPCRCSAIRPSTRSSTSRRPSHERHQPDDAAGLHPGLRADRRRASLFRSRVGGAAGGWARLLTLVGVSWSRRAATSTGWRGCASTLATSTSSSPARSMPATRWA